MFTSICRIQFQNNTKNGLVNSFYILKLNLELLKVNRSFLL